MINGISLANNVSSSMGHSVVQWDTCNSLQGHTLLQYDGAKKDNGNEIVPAFENTI